MSTLYTVVYGAEWEDIMYFTNLDKALYKLAVQARGAMNDPKPDFWPIMHEYIADDGGVFRRSKTRYEVDYQKWKQGINDPPISVEEVLALIEKKYA